MISNEHRVVKAVHLASNTFATVESNETTASTFLHQYSISGQFDQKITVRRAQRNNTKSMLGNQSDQKLPQTFFDNSGRKKSRSHCFFVHTIVLRS